jgi:long-chain acyl-CoA synthetase
MTETSSLGTGHPEQGSDKGDSTGLMLPGVEMDVVALDDPAKALPPAEIRTPVGKLSRYSLRLRN